MHMSLDAEAPAAGPAADLHGFAPERLQWPNRYTALGAPFAVPQPGQPLPAPRWTAVNPAAAALLGWPAQWWRAPGALAAFSGGTPWPGMQPAATVYSGHQFGVWAGQLGDGRALLLGEVATPHGGIEVQLKGSGMTPYSRMGDGRAVLRSSIREYLCSEAMHALGIPTTRALALVESDLPVRRETVETAAVVTRLASSFVRFGHFEHFAHHGQHDALQRLFDHVVDQHLPACRDAATPVAALLDEVVRRTAALIAQWQAVGFCHGVMNTDNLSILGLTLDYGPFGFLDGFDPGHVCNHSDTQGRYAYGRQPQVAYWNLHALAHALQPLAVRLDGDQAAALHDALGTFPARFGAALMARMRAKLGLATAQADDAALVDDLMRLMAGGHSDFTLTFRRLALLRAQGDGAGEAPLRDLFLDRAAFDAWARRYRARLQAEGSVDAERAARMNRVNPLFVLRNHLAQTAIERAQAGDAGEIERLMAILARPYDDQPEHAAYAGLPPDWAGTLSVSCSS